MSGEDNQVHHPPIRDATTLKNVLYGPGHEKFPSWPIAAAADAPRATRAPPTGSSQRSKSWTDHTNYPKENLVAYTRPYMRRSHSSYPHQLKTVVERCEKNSSETFDYINRMNRGSDNLERDGIPSPPERDTQHKRLQDYEILLEDQSLLRYSYNILNKDNPSSLTQADLEEYTRNCEEINIQHQKQPSYAQSEGYHSYVSSTDSTSTPFLDRLRRDIDTTVLRGTGSWDHDSVVTTSSGSASSSETLKWHGSLSDVSVASSSFNHGRQQLIAHSARVQTPQRHNSESVLYIENNRNDGSTRSHYASLNCSGSQSAEPQSSSSLNYSPPSPQRTVAERVHQYEKQATKYTYLDPDKKTKVSDPALKAIQKKALLLFYERHQGQNKSFWRSEPQLSFKSSRSKSKENDSSNDKIRGSSQGVVDIDLSEPEHIKSQPSKISCGDCDSHNTPSIKSPDSLKFFPVNQKEMTSKLKDHSYRTNNHSIDSQLSIAKKTAKSECESIHTGLNKTFSNGVDESFNSNPIIRKSASPFSKTNENNFSHRSFHSTNKKIISPPMSYESQNTELQGPIIIGNSISVDDWVPERPPKNQELLRSVFPDLYREKNRYHSPELPLPSPPLPTCDDEALCSSDEPFPPPPLEIIDEWKYQQEVLDISPPSGIHTFNKISLPELQRPSKQNKETNTHDTNTDILNHTTNFTSKSPIPPCKPKPLKREYPSNHNKVNVASRRNSFANAQDITKDSPIFTANIRASVREKSYHHYQPQKPVISAQRQLYRSITVDQSVVSPKKPINPFLRSTSMKHEVDYKHDGINHTFNPEKSINSERNNLQYHYAQKLSLNAKVALATSEKVNKVSGQYRAEPLRATFDFKQIPQSHKISNIDDKNNVSIDNNMWKPNTEVKRLSLPLKYSETEKLYIAQNKHEKDRNISIDGSDIKDSTYSFCEPGSVSTKTADVRLINLDNSKKSPTHFQSPHSMASSLHPQLPEKNIRRNNAVIVFPADYERGTPDVNSGSYKKINVSLEKSVVSVDVKENIKTVETVLIPSVPLKQNASKINDVQKITECTSEKSNIDSKSLNDEDYSAIEANKNAENISENVAYPSRDDPADCEKPVEFNSTIADESAVNETEVAVKSAACGKGKKTERLKPRSLLAEETVWEMLRSHLSVHLTPDSVLLNLVSQYDEYSNAIESITNIFEIDITLEHQEEIHSPEYMNDKDSQSENEANLNNYCNKDAENQQLLERLQDLSIDNFLTRDDNSESFKKHTSQCLHALISALTAEGIQLEQAASVNEAVGVQLLATAPKSARLSRHAADVGRVTALIAGLATRLARATRPLKLPVHTPERRKILMAKQEKLADQLEEAKRLKESIDARGLALSDTLSNQLSDDFRGQYWRFIATKVKLVVYLRDVQYRLDLAKQLLDHLVQETNLTFLNSSVVRTQVLL